MGNLIGITLNLQNALITMATLNNYINSSILNNYINSKSMRYLFSISLNHLLLHLSMFYSSNISLSPPWLGLFLGNLLFGFVCVCVYVQL